MQKLIVVLLLAAACTKPNPNRCCTDEADCTAKGIPVGSICEQGLVCRGNQCISQPCASSTECDATAPYCVAELCAEACNDDAQCPGFGQAASDRFCVEGACAECRIGMNDCTTAAPVCDQGSCRQCRDHNECQSSVCSADGSCADESSIAYVETNGAANSNCTRTSPCSTIARALMLARRYVLIGPGTYPSTAAIVLSGQVDLIGSGTRPILTRSTPGPIVSISSGQIGVDNLQLSGATTNASDYGYGLYCEATTGAPVLKARRILARDNNLGGMYAQSCSVEVTESTFTNNGRGTSGPGIKIVNGTGVIDRCTVSDNDTGIELDSGLFQVTNCFIFHNDSPSTSYGINLYSTEGGQKIEFNTIVDNARSAVVGRGFNCQLDGVTGSFPNNLFVRNKLQTAGANCTYPSSIVVDTDVTALKFNSPDVPPFDYHIGAGSMAIDAAAGSTVDHDFDGQPRTAPRDVGADEFVP
ncbi:MAG TPA: right-handed parallel beta-helix repeat-containing protein [Kofleriaceae bacterium]|nr:right-handed parallel beta-helix repeat-containing protein [Kofleriaceae bacterium]